MATGLRLFWMLFGNAAIFILAVVIFLESRSHITWRDALYGGLIVALIAARKIDITWYEGQTADGERANMTHFRRYARNLVFTAGLAWAAIHASVLL
jgi:hypothetical protein